MSSFHFDLILSKRSSLAKVWLAAHWERKLSKVQVYETNLQSSVQDILNPRTPIALRTSSHLLVGLVRIYSRKAKYLLTDCSETLVNIKVSFRPGVPLSTLVKPKAKKQVKDVMDCPLFITEKVDLFDQWVPEVSNELDCTLNQSKAEEITLKEEPIKVNRLEDYFEDEGFGDMFVDSEFSEQSLHNSEAVFTRVYSFADSAYGTEDGFLGEASSCYADFSDPVFPLTPIKGDAERKINAVAVDSDMEGVKTNLLPMDTYDELEPEPPTSPPSRTLIDVEPRLEIELVDSYDFKNEISIDPLETSVQLKKKRTPVKRKLAIDHEISMTREAFFDQINNPTGLTDQPELAPTTKRRMKGSIHNTLKSLFSESPRECLAPCLEKLFKSPSCSQSTFVATTPRKEESLEMTIFDDDDDDDGEFISAFIPLHDIDYSSGEEDMPNLANDSVDRIVQSIDNSPKNPNLADRGFHHEGTVADEPPQQGSDLGPGLDFDQEDISHDAFCEFVEQRVEKVSPLPVEFTEVISTNTGVPTRKEVARKFLKCLLMQRDARLHLEQTSHFSPIMLHTGNAHEKNVA